MTRGHTDIVSSIGPHFRERRSDHAGADDANFHRDLPMADGARNWRSKLNGKILNNGTTRNSSSAASGRISERSSAIVYAAADPRIRRCARRTKYGETSLEGIRCRLTSRAGLGADEWSLIEQRWDRRFHDEAC